MQDPASPPLATSGSSSAGDFLRNAGVHQQHTVVNALGFLVSSAIGISLLVFLNAAQAFVLVEIHGTTGSQTTKIAATLIFADELLCLAAVLVWGRLADYMSPRFVVFCANLIAGIGITAFVFAQNVFPQLLLCRLVFAIGASGVTAMLPALLSILAAPYDDHPHVHEPLTPASEDQPLLGWRRPPPSFRNEAPKVPQARLAACLGVSTGLGALLAVFAFLRLPPLVQKHSQTAAGGGLRITFMIVAAMAVCNAALAFLTLPRGNSYRYCAVRGAVSSKQRNSSLLGGFVIASRSKDVALGYAGAFVARVQTVATSAFVPVFVASYYYETGLCVRDPTGTIKENCHPAYALASALTGVIQLASLLSAPLFGFTARPGRTMSIALLLGSLGFFILGRAAFFSSIGDPRSWVTWPAAILIGQSTMAAITLSLALIASGRQSLLDDWDRGDFGDLPSSQNDHQACNTATPHLDASTKAASTLNCGSLGTGDSARAVEVTSPAPLDQAVYHGITDQATYIVHAGHRSAALASDWSIRQQQVATDQPVSVKPELRNEVAGTIAGAYSFCGGLGILTISGVGSLLGASNPAVLFVLIAGLNIILSLAGTALQ